MLAARGATPSAFERRCVPPPPQRGCRVGDPAPGGVAPPSNIPDILGRRALPAGRIAALGATMDLHHGLLGAPRLDRPPGRRRHRAGGAGRWPRVLSRDLPCRALPP